MSIRFEPDAAPLPGPPLRALAARAGLRVGTAVDAAALRDGPGYRHDLATQFSSVTPENAMKWSVLEPSRGDFHWGDADRIVDFAQAHGQAIRGHTLVWWNQVPGWVQQLAPAQLRAAMVAHIRTVMTRYRGRVGTWDVVNEPLGDDGRLRPDSIWTQKLGGGYIPLAFRTARATDPRAQLFLNEIGAETAGPKADALFALAKRLRAEHLIDGVGLQSHFDTTHGLPAALTANLRRLAALGVHVSITEADVSLKHPATPADLIRQAGVYRGIVAACRAVRACTGVTFWGFTDRHSWIPAASPGYGSADLLDSQLRAKPAFRAVQAALRG